MAIGSTMAAILAIGAIASSAAATGITMSQSGKSKSQVMPSMPATATETAGETIAKAKEQAEAGIQAKQTAIRRSRSVYSSPLGIGGEATTARKYLLGQ